MFNEGVTTVTVISFLLSKPITIFGISCPYYYVKEIKENCNGCAVCRNYKHKIGVCDFEILNNTFNPSYGTSCTLVNNCEGESSCKGFPCVPLLGSFKCKCDGSRFGRICQYQMQDPYVKKYAEVENILFTPLFTLDLYATITVLFSFISSRMEIHVKTLLEHLIFDSRACKKISSTEHCRTWYADFPTVCSQKKFKNTKCAVTITIPFPGHSFSPPEREKIRPGDEDRQKKQVLAMKEKIQLEVYDNTQFNFDKPLLDFNITSLNIIQSPHIKVCSPTISVRNGGETMYSRLKIARRHEIEITCSYRMSTLASCAGSDNLKIQWETWKIGVNHNELSEKPVKVIYMEKYLAFESFTLEIGKYKVKLNMSVWVGSEESFEFVYTFFEVVALELEPLIKGGAEKFVHHNIQKLVLDGRLSKDPNSSKMEQHNALLFYWRCDKKVSMLDETQDSTASYSGPFKANEWYTFSLTVHSRKDNHHFKTTYQRVFMTSDPVPTLEIVCYQNCGSDNFESHPAETFYFKVFITDVPPRIKTNNNFTWTYSRGKEENFVPVENIRQPNTPNSVLIVLKNYLLEGQNYTFRVEGGAKSPGQAKFFVKIAKKPDNISCKLNVDVVKNYVRKGRNTIIITCDRVTYKNMPPTYDFYDRYPNEEGKGRLLISGIANVAYKVGLTRGKIVVEVTNLYGMTTEWEATAELILKESPAEFINNQLKELKRLGPTSDSEYKSSTISAATDFIIKEKHNLTNVPEILEYFLKVASEDERIVMEGAKLWANTIDTLATEGLKHGLTVMSVSYLGKVITKVTGILLHDIKASADDSSVLTTALILHLTKKIIESCNGILLSKNEYLTNRTARQEDVYDLESSYKESTILMIKAVDRIMLYLSLRLQPYQSPITFKQGNISIWIKKDTPLAFSKLSIHPTSDKSMPSIVISRGLAVSLRRVSKIITVQLAVYDVNPYWWDSELSIQTDAIDLGIRYKKRGKELYIDRIPNPVQINLKYLEKDVEEILFGSVQQPNPNESIYEADMKVAVHRLRAQNTGRLHLEFLNLNESQGLKVLVLLNIRPDYDLMSSLATNITKKTPYYYKSLGEPSEDFYDFYYLGILPDSQVPVGQFINYSFQISSKHCVSRRFDGWTTRGCDVSHSVIETKQMSCECEHLSIFAAFSNVPMNTIDLWNDHKLFLTIINNPFIAIFVACLLLIYIIVLFWTICKDSVDKYKQCATYLEDNFPDDQYPYLVSVYTGSKLYSGTTSNVGIMIQGDLSSSRYHILKSRLYKTQQRGDDNWFVLYTPSSLGNLNSILLWIDYTGRNPDWFCNKVIIVDLFNDQEYVFLVDSWMSAKQNESIEKIAETVKSPDDMRVDLAVDNLVFGFREAHIWLSVISRHPRSTVLRSHRLTVAFAGVMVTLLVSCMFFKVEDVLEDDAYYNLTMRMFLIGVVSMLISSLLVNITISLFRKSLIYQPFEGGEVEDVEALEEQQEVDYGLDDKKKRRKAGKKIKYEGNIMFRTFNVFLKIFVKRKRFVPVHLSVDVLGVPRGQNVANLVWTIFAWVFCLGLIICSSYFVILYGLKFGRIKSLEWITTVGISLLQTICIVTPLKVFSLATMSGMMAKNIYEVVAYKINLNLLQGYKKWLLRRDPEIEFKLAALRALPMYSPTNNTAILKKRERQKKFDELWIVLDMLLIGLVATIMFFQNETLWTTRYYWNNYQLTSLLRKGYHEEGIQLNIITNVSHYPVLLEKKVFPIIYQTKWYNNQIFKPEGNSSEGVVSSVFSGASKLIGLPRLRQIRMKSGLCKKPLYENLPRYCPAKLSEDTEDTDIYGRGWATRGGYEMFTRSSPWSYMNESQTYDSPLIGYSNFVYNGDGYVAELGMSRQVSSDLVTYLTDENWLDRLTQVIFFELTLYNPNAGTFSWLISVTENLHISMLMNRVYVFTVCQEYKITTIDVFLFCGLAMFTLRIFLLINRRGIKQLVYNFWNVFEIVIVVLSVFCAVLYVKNIKAASQYLEEYNNRSREVYFEFLHLLTNLAEIRVILIVLQVMLLCRFLKSWKFGKVYEIFFYTFYSAWLTCLWIVVIFVVILFYYWRVFSYLLNTFLLPKNNFVVLCNINFKETVKMCDTIGCQMNPFLLCSVSWLTKALIIIHYLYTYRTVKAKFCKRESVNIFRNIRSTEYRNFVLYLHDK